MRAVGRRDTAPELALRRALHRRGLRYRVDLAVLPGSRRRADVVFTSRRVAIYVDGCFWHSCPQHGTVSRSNPEFWAAKLEGNRQRDADTDRRLTAAGWSVVRVWEHEAAEEAADRILRLLEKTSNLA